MRTVAFVALLALTAPASVHAQRAEPLAADTNRDNKLTLDEYQASRRDFFLRFDTNHDGALGGAEWSAGAKRMRNELSANGIDGSGLVGLGVFDMLDTDKSGTVTVAEIDAAAATRFARADTDHDGFASREEISAFLRADMGADTNNDNKVSEAEYQTSRRDFLMRADADKDGVISKAEWTSAAEALQTALSESGVDGGDLVGQAGIFEALDTDRSGTVGRAEIDAASAARFAKADTTHDGYLTRAEIITVSQATR